MEARETQFTISEMPKELRPRELLLSRGADFLSDTQLLQVLLGSGTKGKGVHLLAREVLTVIDGIRGGIKPDHLLSISGLGAAKAAVICAAFEFSRRRLCPGKRKIKSPPDILPAVSHFADRKQEHFLSISLNGAHEIIGVHVVSVGLVNRTLVHPREVYAEPIVERAAAVIAAHNHPSGNVEPSMEDLEITRRLREAGDVLGISLLDHIIFGGRGYYSFLEDGQL